MSVRASHDLGGGQDTAFPLFLQQDAWAPPNHGNHAAAGFHKGGGEEDQEQKHDIKVTAHPACHWSQA